MSSSPLEVRLESEPFAKGNMRLCHRLKHNGRNWVAKRYSDAELSTLESDVMMQMVAKSYAERFNACGPPKKVEPWPALAPFGL